MAEDSAGAAECESAAFYCGGCWEMMLEFLLLTLGGRMWLEIYWPSFDAGSVAVGSWLLFSSAGLYYHDNGTVSLSCIRAGFKEGHFRFSFLADQVSRLWEGRFQAQGRFYIMLLGWTIWIISSCFKFCGQFQNLDRRKESVPLENPDSEPRFDAVTSEPVGSLANSCSLPGTISKLSVPFVGSATLLPQPGFTEIPPSSSWVGAIKRNVVNQSSPLRYYPLLSLDGDAVSISSPPAEVIQQCQLPCFQNLVVNSSSVGGSLLDASLV
ncbi:hypothetical protein Nepgr_003936 [Nepenthes gracilis]|uniref:Uncharacterized protein n=1 Tax=Nepenthes gracilis TaxID=150966 RepID=A0AAD3XEH2_NEPGR|nr:hypothetical protein Nepgr_003936 [Nepenthes gracilis]